MGRRPFTIHFPLSEDEEEDNFEEMDCQGGNVLEDDELVDDEWEDVDDRSDGED
jgi:hypothetical protein